jgi:hypothetical protein
MESLMSVRVILSTVLQAELEARGVESLASSDYQEIVDRMVEQIMNFELALAAKEIIDRHKPN